MEVYKTEALGGYLATCTKRRGTHIAYNSSKHRHRPICHGSAARDWMATPAMEMVPAEFFHVVLALPLRIARIPCTSVQGLACAVCITCGGRLVHHTRIPQDRAGLWSIVKSQSLGRVQAGSLPERLGSITVVSAPVYRRPADSAKRG
ncbi:MAG: transposase zinc-binding domain-containing protein [Roseobacter sp.]